MTGAMYAAISGLRAHMSGLNVIGNNIANVNTNGYKAGRYLFETALYTSVSNGSNGSTTVGGKNPSQIGMGTNMATVDIDMGTSSYVPTGRPMDCMIDGDGFFLLGETKNMTFNTAEDFKSLLLTKVGDLEFKADGTLSNRAGYVVYGFQCVGQVQGDDTTIPVMSNQLSPITLPRQISVMVDVTVANGQETLTVVTDPKQPPAAGATREMRTYAVSTLDQLKKVPGQDAATQATFEALPHVEMDSISIDEKTGRISGTTKDTDQHITIGFLAIGNVTNPNGVTQVTGTYFQCGDGAGSMSISMLGGSAATVYDKANLTGMDVDANGNWSPGAGAAVTVTTGMTHITSNGEAPATDVSDSMSIKTGGTTKLLTSGLEQTNTDLATEISNMIFMQRGYQANTRIVTVTDSMLEELVNMKR